MAGSTQDFWRRSTKLDLYKSWVLRIFDTSEL